MKNKIQFIQFIAIIIFSYGTYAQVEVTVQTLQYTNNGQVTISPANCGIIDLATSSSTYISFGINLRKPFNQVVGLSDLYVYTQRSSSDSRVSRSYAQVQESFWNQPSNADGTYSTTAGFSINSSSFNVSGGTLFVVFKSSGGVEYESCSFQIIKTPTPTFTLAPTSLSLGCNNTDPRNFSVTAVNIPSGANVTYQWSASGWVGNFSTTTNSISLSPFSGTSLPSTVFVTPYIDGVAKPAISCTITRLPFSSLAFISGAGSLCTTANYTMTGLATGQTVQWSVSNSATVSLTNVTSNSVTLNKIQNGSVVLTATILNPCGQTTTKTKTINIGPPNFLYNNMAGDTNPLTGETISYSVTAPSSYSTLQWYFDYGGVISTTANGWQILTGQGTTAITAKAGNPGYVYVVCKATNSCGNSTQYLPVLVRSLTDPCNGPPLGFRIAFKNPIRESENIEATLRPILDPCDGFVVKMSDENVKKEVQIYDLFGNLIYQSTFKNDDFKINLSTQKIKKGTYFMNVLIDGFEKQQQTIIVE
jgi:hypothetical protein